MNIHEMTRKDFEALPHRKEWAEEIRCSSLIIIPGRAKDLHDSGYRCMDFVAVRGGEAFCLLSGGSDAIHLDGIGGYGRCMNTNTSGLPKVKSIRKWNMDCLTKSGLLHIWCTGRTLVAGVGVGSFELWAELTKGNEEWQR